MGNQIKGGKSDKMSLEDIARKHSAFLGTIKQQLEMGIEVEKEHTPNPEIAKEIAMDHLAEFPDYYTRLSKMEKQAKKTETKECTGADASGSYEAPFSGTILKRDIHKLHNWKTKQKDVKEQMDAGVSAGAMYDGPIGTAGPSSPMDKTKKRRKDPLAIDNTESIQGASITGPSTKDMIATKKGFPGWGGKIGEGGKNGPKIVTINDKCKKFPYCNQGASSDNSWGRPNPLKLSEIIEMREAIQEASKKYKLPASLIAKMVSEAYTLPSGIDFTPAKTWGKGGKGQDYIYTLVTDMPLNVTTKDLTQFEKLKLALRQHDVKFNESKRPATDKDIEPEISKTSDDDENIDWPEDDDDIFANMK